MQEASQSKHAETQMWLVTQANTTFWVRSLSWQDTAAHAAYQALRYQVFSEQLHWAVAVTADGREVDRYDQGTYLPMWTHTVSALQNEQEEHLLAGVRTCTLRDWEDAMVMSELQAAGLFSAVELGSLCASYSPEHLLEVTRLCVLRPRHQDHQQGWTTRMQLQLAQLLAYAGVYQVAEHTGRSLVLAVVSAGYLRLLARLGFVVQICAAHALQKPAGYALTIIDLAASIQAMRAQGNGEQATRLLLLCQDQQWIEDIIRLKQAKRSDPFPIFQGEEL